MQNLVVSVVFTDFSVFAIGRYAQHIYVGQPEQYPDIPRPVFKISSEEDPLETTNTIQERK